MKSMTGFGSSSIGNQDFKTFISVKSVNSRFISVKYYLSSYYSSLESEFRKEISKKCSRGHFFISVNRVPENPSSTFVLKTNKEQAKKWKDIYEKLSKDLKIKNNLSTNDLAHKTGVITVVEKQISLSQLEKVKVNRAFQKALNSCLKERSREGAALKQDIMNYVKTIHFYLKKIQKISKQKEKKQADLDSDQNSIDEEITRLLEHLKHFKVIVESTQSHGKKMDFYVQEMLREVNTIGAKSQTPSLTKHVVEIKFTLEKIKEQVQNIE
ncbi:MAG: endoribonuclease YicC domain-containing protein [Bdellovibrionales bacterium]